MEYDLFGKRSVLITDAVLFAFSLTGGIGYG